MKRVEVLAVCGATWAVTAALLATLAGLFGYSPWSGVIAATAYCVAFLALATAVEKVL